jgi:hypothetical protein
MRAQWDRIGLVIGLIVALAIMWGTLGYVLISGDDGTTGGGQSVIYKKADRQAALDDDR